MIGAPMGGATPFNQAMLDRWVTIPMQLRQRVGLAIHAPLAVRANPTINRNAAALSTVTRRRQAV
jgi:hypothetical protein